jgi:hypothetical protein
MVEKRRAKGAQNIMTELGLEFGLEFSSVGSKITSQVYSYPDKIAITNLLCRGLPTQLKGGYKR